MKSRWLHLLITIFIIFSYMQFEYVRYCMECDAGYQEYSYANAVINIVGDRYLIIACQRVFNCMDHCQIIGGYTE